MSYVKIRYKIIQERLQVLEEGLLLLEKQKDPEWIMFIIHAIIKRFDLSMITFTKFLEIYIQKAFVTFVNHKNMIHVAHQRGIFVEKELCILINAMTDHHNIPQTIDDLIAKEIVQRIPIYFITMKQIVDRIQIKD